MNELAAGNGAERASALLKLTHRLTALIEQETTLFEAKRPHEALVLQDEKSRLANIYRHEVGLAGKDSKRLEGASPAAKLALRQATEAFHAALERNGHVVNALRTVTEGVVKAVADEAARRRQDQAGYGAAGRAVSTQGRAPAVAVDRSA